MLSTLSVIFPIFGLILAGYACRRRNLLGPAAASELNRFVVWLALPALLFDITAHASWSSLYQPRFIATFGLACTGVFAATLCWRLRAGRHIADASVDAIAASYANTGYIGFPLCLLVFGRSSMALASMATIWVVCVLFAMAVVLIEIGLQQRQPGHRMALMVAGRIFRNPLILAPLAGALAAAVAVPMPVPAAIDNLLKLLGDAASPCALVSLGLFLAERRTPVSISARGVPALLALIKLAAMPAITWLLATQVFFLPPAMMQAAVLLAALPTGSGPFMLAEFYRREAHVTSQAILFSTVGSLLTLSLLLQYFHAQQ